jgi:3',5'-cyclic AMP phosphodiesterase CpdA
VWLERVLADNPNRWTIVTFHHPLFSAAGGRDYPELRTLWGPLFERYRVDLVLQGHDHAYARGSLSPAPERGPDAWRSPGATMYVVSVSGAKMYPVQRQRWMTRAAERTPLFQIITIDGDKLFFEARTALGEVYDAFELRKRRNRPNQVVDRIPKDEPERVGADSVTH